jgi:hypothetical protein
MALDPPLQPYGFVIPSMLEWSWWRLILGFGACLHDGYICIPPQIGSRQHRAHVSLPPQYIRV